jgi:hypothetical protein
VGVEETELALAPGEHTLCAQAADADHVAGEATAEVTFTVVGGDAGATTSTEEEEAEGGGDETWEGTVTGTFQAGPDCTPGTSDGRISVVVERDPGGVFGAVTGEGSTTSSEYTCAFPEGSTTISETVLPYTITGSKGEDEKGGYFELTFSDGVTMTLEISGTTATGTQDMSAGGGYTSVTTVELTCVSGC